MIKFVYLALFVAFMGIAASVGWKVLENNEHKRFMAQVTTFQEQTATYNNDKIYEPGEDLIAEWRFSPIIWDTPFVMTVTFLFKNIGNDKIYVTGETRVLPFFNQVQYQVSEPTEWDPAGDRIVYTSYRIPAQVEDGNYVIKICQQFDHDSNRTDWSCYDGPTFEVKSPFSTG